MLKYFKIWFAFCAFLALAIIALTVWGVAQLVTDPPAIRIEAERVERV